jgi:uncharacterized protein
MKRICLALVLVILSVAGAWADEVPIPPAPTRWVTDTGFFMRPDALQAVDRMLEDYERATGHQVLVWIGTTTGDTPLEDWTIKAFAAWKVGRKGLDDGLILFVFATDHRARIEVGYGLEGTVPDIVASRILNDVVIPRIQAGDKDGAILAGVNAIRGVLSGDSAALNPGGEPQPAPAAGLSPEGGAGQRPARSISCFEMVVAGVVIIGFLILLVTNPSLAMYLLFSILSGGRGGGGGGGGGFSGGGGRSGGGGASGSW